MKPVLRGVFSRLAPDFKNIILVVAVSVLVMTSIIEYRVLQKQVTVQVDGKTETVSIVSGTVEEVLTRQGIILGEKDVVIPASGTEVQEGLRVVVKRAFPVLVTVAGQNWEILTPPANVAGILERAGITLNSNDRTVPGLEQEVQPGDNVRVIRVTQKEVAETKALSYITEKRDEQTLEHGIRKIVQRGRQGLEKTLIRLTYEDGREVGKEVIGREVVKKPVNQIIATGTITVASRGGRSFRFREARMMNASAYTHTGNRTYTGVYPQVGMVAVDPKVIPLNSRLYVEGYGYAVARDIGGAIKGDRVDLFMETKQEALRWGRKTVKVYLLE